ncbi:MAG: hypothetical protein RLZZ293_632 [Pseudomonadota bacterium]|jgi:SAM-dependent methyltransferase
MAHREQIEYCSKIKQKFPAWFTNKLVLDIGSLDINGNNQYLFENCLYLGVDIGNGPNVDIVAKAHELNLPDQTFDLIISTECFEHDMYYNKTIQNLYRLLKSGGLLLFTCATEGRAEHGTRRTTPQDAFLLPEYDNWNDYYKNLTEFDFWQVLDFDKMFSYHEFEINQSSHDIYFYGFKLGDHQLRSDYSFLIPENQTIQKFKHLQHELMQLNNNCNLLNEELAYYKVLAITIQQKLANYQDNLIVAEIICQQTQSLLTDCTTRLNNVCLELELLRSTRSWKIIQFLKILKNSLTLRKIFPFRLKKT